MDEEHTWILGLGSASVVLALATLLLLTRAGWELMSWRIEIQVEWQRQRDAVRTIIRRMDCLDSQQHRIGRRIAALEPLFLDLLRKGEPDSPVAKSLPLQRQAGIVGLGGENLGGAKKKNRQQLHSARETEGEVAETQNLPSLGIRSPMQGLSLGVIKEENDYVAMK